MKVRLGILRDDQQAAEKNGGVLNKFAAPAVDPRGVTLIGKLGCFSCLKFTNEIWRSDAAKSLARIHGNAKCQ